MKASTIESAIVLQFPSPDAVPMTMPATSPIEQPVRQCSVALNASRFNDRRESWLFADTLQDYLAPSFDINPLRGALRPRR